MRYSQQKEVILDTLRSTTCHPTAEWVYGEAKKVLPDIGLSTVYRNLLKLEKEGKIIRIICDSGIEHYDGTTTAHGHFVCTECGKVLDTDISDELSDVILRGAEGLSVKRFNLVYYGICTDCK